MDNPWLFVLRICSYSFLAVGVILLLFIAFVAIVLARPKADLKLKVRLFQYRYFALFLGVIVAVLFFVSALITTTITDSLVEKRLLLALLSIVSIAYFLLWLVGRFREKESKDEEIGDGDRG
ncbi:hypothetical protein ES703_88400 [subsurface metagenome]